MRESIDPAVGMMPAMQARENRRARASAEGELIAQGAKLLMGVYKTWWESDAAMVEINPLCIIKGADGKQTLQAVDAKISVDDNALYRHPNIQAMRDLGEEAPLEIEASKFNLKKHHQLKLISGIACLHDERRWRWPPAGHGHHPAFWRQVANFLDVGVCASKRASHSRFQNHSAGPARKRDSRGYFGGIMDYNVIATGIVAVAKETGLKFRWSSRLEGTTSRPSKKNARRNQGCKLISGGSAADAAQNVVKAVGTTH